MYDACVSILSSQGPTALDLWKVEYFDAHQKRIKCNFDGELRLSMYHQLRGFGFGLNLRSFLFSSCCVDWIG